MSFLRLVKYKEPYATLLPLMTIYSTILGINVGMIKNTRNNETTNKHKLLKPKHKSSFHKQNKTVKNKTKTQQTKQQTNLQRQ